MSPSPPIGSIAADSHQARQTLWCRVVWGRLPRGYHLPDWGRSRVQHCASLAASRARARRPPIRAAGGRVFNGAGFAPLAAPSSRRIVDCAPAWRSSVATSRPERNTSVEHDAIRGRGRAPAKELHAAGHDLDAPALAAILVGPGALAEPAFDVDEGPCAWTGRRPRPSAPTRRHRGRWSAGMEGGRRVDGQGRFAQLQGANRHAGGHGRSTGCRAPPFPRSTGHGTRRQRSVAAVP
jgi:hypothetical protein